MQAKQSTKNPMHWTVILPNGEAIAISALCAEHAVNVAQAHWSYQTRN